MHNYFTNVGSKGHCSEQQNLLDASDNEENVNEENVNEENVDESSENNKNYWMPWIMKRMLMKRMLMKGSRIERLKGNRGES